MDYFALLSLSKAFDIDLSALEANYFKAQRDSHPDRFVGKPPAERQKALQHSADINQAYETLKNPLKRAQYLLRLQGISVGTEADSVKPSHALLTEVMEWREAVDEARTPVDISKSENQLNAMREQSTLSISNAYKKSAWDEMAQHTIKLGYILKTLDELNIRKKRL